MLVPRNYFSKIEPFLHTDKKVYFCQRYQNGSKGTIIIDEDYPGIFDFQKDQLVDMYINRYQPSFRFSRIRNFLTMVVGEGSVTQQKNKTTA